MATITKEDEKSKTIIEYKPKKLSQEIAQTAIDFISQQQKGNGTSGFRISELIADKSGIKDVEDRAFQKNIEEKALERLKEVQEAAYQEAYNIGLEEGRAEGQKQSQEGIKTQLQILDSLVQHIHTIKSDILQKNEAQLVEFIYHIASLIAVKEITADPGAVIPVLKKTMESVQEEQNISVKVSPQDFEYIKKLIESSGVEYEFLKEKKFEASENIRQGGCVVETNYGTIDASVEERVKRAWEVLSETRPQKPEGTF